MAALATTIGNTLYSVVPLTFVMVSVNSGPLVGLTCVPRHSSPIPEIWHHHHRPHNCGSPCVPTFHWLEPTAEVRVSGQALGARPSLGPSGHCVPPQKASLDLCRGGITLRAHILNPRPSSLALRGTERRAGADILTPCA